MRRFFSLAEIIQSIFFAPVQEKEGERKAEPDGNEGELFLLGRQGGINHLLGEKNHWDLEILDYLKP